MEGVASGGRGAGRGSGVLGRAGGWRVGCGCRTGEGCSEGAERSSRVGGLVGCYLDHGERLLLRASDHRLLRDGPQRQGARRAHLLLTRLAQPAESGWVRNARPARTCRDGSAGTARARGRGRGARGARAAWLGRGSARGLEGVSGVLNRAGGGSRAHGLVRPGVVVRPTGMSSLA
jgi:hypothetical protein